MSIESKIELKCDANGCSSCYKSAVGITLPPGWTEKEGKHYCKTHSPKKKLSKKQKKQLLKNSKHLLWNFPLLIKKEIPCLMK